MAEKKKVCMMCAKPSDVSICDACKAQVQGEALDKKIKIEREVKLPPDPNRDKE
ncbi:MAG: hypothetical protein ACT4NX_05345 [Deltaproteobacteria bacterium]